MEVKEILKTSDYNFLRTNEKLETNICYLTVGGSIAYGTNLPKNSLISILEELLPKIIKNYQKVYWE